MCCSLLLGFKFLIYITCSDDGKYSGEYSFDKATGEIRGCPARSASVKAIVHSVKVRDKDKGASATRNHAEAMTVEDLRKIMSWSERECPANVQSKEIDGLVHQLEHGFMRAFLSSGFTLWTRSLGIHSYPKVDTNLICFYRCFELLDLQPRDIQFDAVGPPPHCLPCFKVELLNRKGWQNEKGYEGARERKFNFLVCFEDPVYIHKFSACLQYLPTASAPRDGHA